MMEITLRKGTAAAHYVLGGPQGNDNNAFSIGTATTEIYVMHGETAAAAMYARRLVKEEKAGEDLQPTIDKMNALIQDYAKQVQPEVLRQGRPDRRDRRHERHAVPTSRPSPTPAIRTPRASARSIRCCCRASSATTTP